jgi:hypothetical protein
VAGQKRETKMPDAVRQNAANERDRSSLRSTIEWRRAEDIERAKVRMQGWVLFLARTGR